ncbi:MAG: hypothetical protein V3S01_05720 [Dehalococcoidia bacterium]
MSGRHDPRPHDRNVFAVRPHLRDLLSDPRRVHELPAGYLAGWWGVHLAVPGRHLSSGGRGLPQLRHDMCHLRQWRAHWLHIVSASAGAAAGRYLRQRLP